MALQCLSDNLGKPTAVVIPLAEWNSITEKYKDLKILEKKDLLKKRKPSDFVGCISKETAEKMVLDIENSRNEWERNF